MIDISKIIRAPINGSKYTETAPLWKEHYGIYLKIEGADLPETYEVDFSNDEFNGSSVTMIGNADGVLIPRQFIDTGRDVFAFLYWVGEDYGKTVYKFKIPNRFRPDRTNEQPTPEEQSTIDQAISALNLAVEQTAQDVIDAGGYASDARGYAGQAESAKDTAEGYATDASGYAERAETAESNAEGYAQSASESAQTASDKADAITGLTAQATTLPAGSSATASYNSQTGVMTLGIPRGADGSDGQDGADGRDGVDGQDGYSPTASVSKSGDTATITITDKNGTTTAQISDGSGGGSATSPTASVAKVGDTATITITDINGTTTASISDGKDGTNGTNGQDGYSPTASVSKSGGTATITITDKNGTTTATVSDGTNGQNGTNGTDGTTFTPSVSNAGVISWTNDGGKQNPSSVDLVAAIPEATTQAAGKMSTTDKGRLDTLYADYSSALTALGVI